jgi:hypothetical protein
MRARKIDSNLLKDKKKKLIHVGLMVTFIIIIENKEKK